MAKKITRWIALITGSIIFIIGAILFPLPIPLGIPFMIIGLMIAAYNPLALRGLRHLRGRHPRINAKLHHITPKMPHLIQRFLHRTDRKSKKSSQNKEGATNATP